MNATPLFDEFDQQLAILCAGFNKPCTNQRRDAYRKSLGRLSNPAWSRLVEYCISENGPDDLPTTKECWRIYRGLRARAPSDERPKSVEEGSSYSRSAILANELLIDWLNWHIRNQGEAIPESLARAMYAEVHQLAGQMQMLRDDGDPDATGTRFLAEFCSRVLTLLSVESARRYQAYVLAKQHKRSAKEFANIEVEEQRVP